MAVFALLHVETKPRRHCGRRRGAGHGGRSGRRRSVDTGLRLAGHLHRPDTRRDRARSPPLEPDPGPSRCRRRRYVAPARRRSRWRRSRRLDGLLLLVLLLVAGWNLDPLAAAAIVTVLPIGAVIDCIVGPSATTRAAADACSSAAACSPSPGCPTRTLAGRRAAAVGRRRHGPVVAALGGELLPERNSREAAVLLTIRLAGIVLALVLIAPIAANRLTTSTDRAKLQGIAIVLDAKLSPLDKLRVAPKLCPRSSRGAAADAGDGSHAAAWASTAPVADLQRARRPSGRFCSSMRSAPPSCQRPDRRSARTARCGGACRQRRLVPDRRRAIAGDRDAGRLRRDQRFDGTAVAHDRRSLQTAQNAGQRRHHGLPPRSRARGARLGRSRTARRARRWCSHSRAPRRHAYERRYGVNPRSAGGIFEQASSCSGWTDG